MTSQKAKYSVENIHRKFIASIEIRLRGFGSILVLLSVSDVIVKCHNMAPRQDIVPTIFSVLTLF